MVIGTLTELNAGNSSRASHVWRVDGPDGPYVARRPWWSTPEVSPFMAGLVGLFGVDPRDLSAVADAYDFWRGLKNWAVPRTLGRAEVLGAPALLVEWIDGEPARDLTAADAAELGRKVAATHAYALDYFGPLTETAARGCLVEDFYPRALTVLDGLTQHVPLQDWAEHRTLLTQAPPPTWTAPMLLDWCGDQFIWRGGQLYALVDVEASVYAPPELDVCLWEVLLTAEQCRAFQQAYTEQMPFPDLDPHRAACRLILRALVVEGRPALKDWLALPAHFTHPPASRTLP